MFIPVSSAIFAGMTSAAMAGGQDTMLSVVDCLAGKIRKEAGGQKS